MYVEERRLIGLTQREGKGSRIDSLMCCNRNEQVQNRCRRKQCRKQPGKVLQDGSAIAGALVSGGRVRALPTSDGGYRLELIVPVCSACRCFS